MIVYEPVLSKRGLVVVLVVLVILLCLALPAMSAPASNVFDITVTATPDTGLPVLTTTALPTSEPPVTLTGSITGGSLPILERGFVWSHNSHFNPGNVSPIASSYEEHWTELGAFGLGEFTHQPDGLENNIDYYGRSYALNSEGFSYGNEVVFDPVTGGSTWVETFFVNALTAVIALIVVVVVLLTGVSLVSLVSVIIGVIAIAIVRGFIL